MYLVIKGSATTIDLSTSSENTPFVLVIRRPEASVRTVAHASSSHTCIFVTGHSLRGRVADAVVQIPSRLKEVHSEASALDPVISKTAFVGSAFVIA